MAVNVTESAAREICNIIEQQELDADKICLRVGVKGGGCSGFSYILDLTESIRDSDEVWTQEYVLAPLNEDGEPITAEATADGGDAGAATAVQTGEGTPFSLRIVCDPKSYLYLNGAEVDFKDDGMMTRGFVFNNPNASATCGCGSSFGV